MFFRLMLILGIGVFSNMAWSGLNTTYEVQLPFDFSNDTLCFNNYNLESGPWILKQIGHKYGVCQGIVGVARSFRNHAIFNCAGAKSSNGFARGKINQVLDLDQSGESGAITIDGYCSLEEFCKDHQKLFEWAATILNGKLAITALLKHVYAFNQGITAEAQVENMQSIQTIFEKLNAGDTPLIAVPWHVVMVTGMKIDRQEKDGNYRIELSLYNPNNRNKSATWVYFADENFKRTINAYPLFVISP